MRIEECKEHDRLSTRQGILELINTHKILPLGTWGCKSGLDTELASQSGAGDSKLFL